MSGGFLIMGLFSNFYQFSAGGIFPDGGKFTLFLYNLAITIRGVEYSTQRRDRAENGHFSLNFNGLILLDFSANLHSSLWRGFLPKSGEKKQMVDISRLPRWK